MGGTITKIKSYFVKDNIRYTDIKYVLPFMENMEDDHSIIIDTVPKSIVSEDCIADEMEHILRHSNKLYDPDLSEDSEILGVE